MKMYTFSQAASSRNTHIYLYIHMIYIGVYRFVLQRIIRYVLWMLNSCRRGLNHNA